MGVHLLQNVELTALYVNYMEFRHLPGVIGLVGEAQSKRGLSLKHSDWRSLMLRFDYLFSLRLEFGGGNSKKERTGQAMDGFRYETIKSMWIYGRYPSNKIVVQKLPRTDPDIVRYRSSARFLHFVAFMEELERIRALIQQIEQHLQ